VLDVPPSVDADGVKTPKNVYQETKMVLAEMLRTAQNGFIKHVSVLNVVSINPAKLAPLIHSVAGVKKMVEGVLLKVIKILNVLLKLSSSTLLNAHPAQLPQPEKKGHLVQLAKKGQLVQPVLLAPPVLLHL